jgi:hypothetical protein
VIDKKSEKEKMKGRQSDRYSFFYKSNINSKFYSENP